MATELDDRAPKRMTWHSDNTPKSIWAIRDEARNFLTRWEVPNRDDVMLVLAELLANAVMHGGGGTTVVLSLPGGIPTVEVGDNGERWPCERSADDDNGEQPADELRETGRGLEIIAKLATRWGVTQPAGGTGKIVWAVCDPAAPPAEERHGTAA